MRTRRWHPIKLPHAHRPSGAERGFTLIETMMAMAASIVVVGLPMAFLVVSIHGQDSPISRSFNVRRANLGLEALARDLRNAAATLPSGVLTGTTGVVASVVAGTSNVQFQIGEPVSVNGEETATTGVTWTCGPTAGCTRRSTVGATTVNNNLIPDVSAVGVCGYGSIGNPFQIGSTPSQGCPAGITGPTSSYGPDPLSLMITLTIKNSSSLPGGTTNTTAYGDQSPIVLSTSVALRNF